MLETRLAASPTDADAQWLLLHALFAQLVEEHQARLRPTRERFTTLARAYVDAKGANSARWPDAESSYVTKIRLLSVIRLVISSSLAAAARAASPASSASIPCVTRP